VACSRSTDVSIGCWPTRSTKRYERERDGNVADIIGNEHTPSVT